MRLQEKWEATKLRKSGLSYSEILTKIAVSKSTLRLWLRGIKLTPKQQSNLFSKMDRIRYDIARRKVAKRIKTTNEIIEQAKKEVRFLSKNDLFLVGLSLYWAEGAKNSSEHVCFANSDESMILLIMKWFRSVCRVPEHKFRIHLHIHNLHHQPKSEKYWSKLTGIPQNQFYKTFIKQSTLGQRRNILYNGTCSIIVNDKALFRRIAGWKLGLLDYYKISPCSSTDRTPAF